MEIGLESYTRVMDLFTGILVGYCIGFYFWCLVDWYYDKKAKANSKTRTFETHRSAGDLTLEVDTIRNLRILPLGGTSGWPGKVRVENISWVRGYDEIEVVATFVSYTPPEVLNVDTDVSAVCSDKSDKPLSSGPRMNPYLAENKLWKILSPKGRYLCHVSAPDSQKALQKYALQERLLLFAPSDLGKYRAVEDKPTSPPPPPKDYV